MELDQYVNKAKELGAALQAAMVPEHSGKALQLLHEYHAKLAGITIAMVVAKDITQQTVEEEWLKYTDEVLAALKELR